MWEKREKVQHQVAAEHDTTAKIRASQPAAKLTSRLSPAQSPRDRAHETALGSPLEDKDATARRDSRNRYRVLDIDSCDKQQARKSAMKRFASHSTSTQTPDDMRHCRPGNDGSRFLQAFHVLHNDAKSRLAHLQPRVQQRHAASWKCARTNFSLHSSSNTAPSCKTRQTTPLAETTRQAPPKPSR